MFCCPGSGHPYYFRVNVGLDQSGSRLKKPFQDDQIRITSALNGTTHQNIVYRTTGVIIRVGFHLKRQKIAKLNNTKIPFLFLFILNSPTPHLTNYIKQTAECVVGGWFMQPHLARVWLSCLGLWIG